MLKFCIWFIFCWISCILGENTCKTGFHLAEDQICQPNICTCKNGTPLTGVECLEHNLESCRICNPGYHRDKQEILDALLNQEKELKEEAKYNYRHRNTRLVDSVSVCHIDTCQCDNGTPYTGLHCPTEFLNYCEFCDPGFKKVKIKVNYGRWDEEIVCQANTCFCTHGTVSAFCREDGAESCETCETGYILDTSFKYPVCLENKSIKTTCSCFNGVATIKSGCNVRRWSCSSCNQGYHLERLPNSSDQICVANQCQCNHGLAPAGEDCLEHQAQFCLQCHEGFRKIGLQYGSYCALDRNRESKFSEYDFKESLFCIFTFGMPGIFVFSDLRPEIQGFHIFRVG